MEKNIGFNDKYNFGVEIEFANKEKTLSEIYDKSKEYIPSLKFLFNHKSYDNSFNCSILDEDTSVTTVNHKEFYGGEISSRILSDDYDSWNEIEKICKLLIDNNSFIDCNCGEHINIDISRYLENPNFFETLYKLLLVYEPEIELFYNGEKNYTRETKYRYACSMRKRLFDNIEKVDFNNRYFIDNIRHKSRAFRINDGLSFYKLYNCGKLIEIRYPNGTLNPDIIQNNINFSLSILSAIEDKKIDIDLLNYLIEQAKQDQSIFNDNFNLYFQASPKIDSLLNQICQNEKSRDNFTQQYQKILTR